MNSWSKGTKLQYKPHITRWLTCRERKLDPFQADIHEGAEFLVACYRSSSTEYFSVNIARSALSAIIKPINGITFRRHLFTARV